MGGSVGRTRRAIAALAFMAAASLASPAPASPPEDPVPVDDFEDPAIAAGWSFENADASIVDEPSSRALEVRGKAVTVDGTASASVALPVKDLRRFGAVAFRIRALSGPATLQAFLRKGKTCRFLEERIEPKGREWTDVVLPLKWMVPVCYFLMPDPRELDRFEIRWQGQGGVYRIDDLRLLPGDRGEDSWRVTDQEILELAYGPGQGKILPGKHFSLLSDSADWQGPEATRFLADLEKGVALLESQWGLAPPPGLRIPLVGAADHNSSNPVNGRIHMAFLAEGLYPARALDRGVHPYDMAYPPPKKGTLGKPTAIGMETWIAHASGFGDRTWLVKAFYYAYVRRACPEEFAKYPKYYGALKAEDFQARLLGRKDRIPSWKSLFDSETAQDNVPILLSIPEFLAASFRPKLPKIWEALRAADGDPGIQGMEPVAKALGLPLAKLEDQWLRWGAASWR